MDLTNFDSQHAAWNMLITAMVLFFIFMFLGYVFARNLREIYRRYKYGSNSHVHAMVSSTVSAAAIRRICDDRQEAIMRIRSKLDEPCVRPDVALNFLEEDLWSDAPEVEARSK